MRGRAAVSADPPGGLRGLRGWSRRAAGRDVSHRAAHACARRAACLRRVRAGWTRQCRCRCTDTEDGAGVWRCAVATRPAACGGRKVTPCTCGAQELYNLRSVYGQRKRALEFCNSTFTTIGEKKFCILHLLEDVKVLHACTHTSCVLNAAAGAATAACDNCCRVRQQHACGAPRRRGGGCVGREDERRTLAALCYVRCASCALVRGKAWRCLTRGVRCGVRFSRAVPHHVRCRAGCRNVLRSGAAE